MSDASDPVEGALQLTHDTVFSVLSNQRRRFVIYYLADREEPARVREMATQLAAWENELPASKLSYQQRKRVYTSLHQTHLPKLDDSGFVEYDRDRKTVTLTDRAETLETYLDPADEEDVAWERVYLALAGICGVSVGLASIGVPPFAQVPGLAYAGATAVALTIVATVHVRHSRSRTSDAASRLEPDVPQRIRSSDETN